MAEYDNKLDRMQYLMGYKMPIAENKSNVEFYKLGADNKVYGIIREGAKYYIKTTELGKEKISESYEYIGGANRRNEHAYNSYNVATKHLENELAYLNESLGTHVDSSTVDFKRSEKTLANLTEAARTELNRINRIFENSLHIGKDMVEDEESKGTAKAEETEKNNAPFSDKVNADMEFDGKKGTVDGATENKEVAKSVDADLQSDKKKTANSGSQSDYKDTHDDLDGEGVADKDPKGGKVVRVNEDIDDVTSEMPTDAPADAPVDTPMNEDEAELNALDNRSVDDLTGFGDDEDDLDALLREFDEEMSQEEITEDAAVVGPKETLDGPHGKEDVMTCDAMDESKDGNVNDDAKEGGEESLSGPHGKLDVQTWDKIDESEISEIVESVFNKLTKKKTVKESLEDKINRIVKEEVTKLDAWGKHPRYQQPAFETPANKEVLAGTAEKDWNDDSAKGEQPYGKKIGSGAPFDKEVKLNMLTDMVMANIKENLSKKK